MFPISFNVSGIKLNYGHFFSVTVITHFLDKPYKEISLKSHLNSALLCKKDYSQICTCLEWFYFTLLVCTHFCNKIKKCQFQTSLKYFSILRPMKNNVRFEYVPRKNAWFFFIFVLWFHFSHKSEKFRFSKSLKY